MAIARTCPVERGSLLLHDVDWRTYSRLLRAFAERPGVRLTYDRGGLELMSPSSEHEGDAYVLGRFVDALTEELGIPVKSGRTMTLRRKRKQRGLEPDNCYWISREAQVRGKRHIDLRIDPAPDLAIEIDITHGSLNRLAIYAALGVSEIWHLDQSGLTFYILDEQGRYSSVTNSRAFPFLRPADLIGFLARLSHLDETTVLTQFRLWVRHQRDKRSAGPTA